MTGNGKIPNAMIHLDRFRSYVSLPNNSAGGSLHIWLDDNNIENHSIEFCLNNAKERNDAEGESLALLGLQMSKTQRSKIASLVYKEVKK